MPKRILIIVTNFAAYTTLWDNFKKEYEDNLINNNITKIDINSCGKIYIIKQQDRKNNTDGLLNNIINNSEKNVSIIIVYHKDSISTNNFNKFFLVPFHHSGNCEIYKDHLLSLSEGRKDFNKVWEYLLIIKSNYHNTLRSKILTPFIPFHLYYQYKDKLEDKKKKEWKDEILNNAHTKIKEITDGKLLKELLELKTNVNDDEIKKVKEQGVFAELKKYFSHDISECMDNDCNDKIQKFANYLEEVVDSIETGDESQC